MPGRARTPGRHRRLGGPLPRQRPNTTTARPEADESFGEASMPTPSHRWGLPAVSRGYTHPRGWLPSPYSPLRRWCIAAPARLACLIHAANVHSEPGSNPSQMVLEAKSEDSPPRSPFHENGLRKSDSAAPIRPEGRSTPPPVLLKPPRTRRRTQNLVPVDAFENRSARRPPSRVHGLLRTSLLLAWHSRRSDRSPPRCCTSTIDRIVKEKIVGLDFAGKLLRRRTVASSPFFRRFRPTLPLVGD